MVSGERPRAGSQLIGVRRRPGRLNKTDRTAIAAGQSSADAVIADWMSSDGHCANLMNADFRDMALARAPGTATSAHKT